MRLNQLQYLVFIKKHGSFSKAAQELFISQPSISVAIRELEEELGYPLLIRNNKKLCFTSDGESVLEKAEAILAEVESIRQLAPQKDAALSGKVRIGGTPHFCNSILLDVMLTLRKESPGISLDIRAYDDSRIISLVESTELDLGLVQTCNIDEAGFSKKMARGAIIYHPLFKERLCFVVGENDPLGERSEVSLDELLKKPYVAFQNSHNYEVGNWFRQRGREDLLVSIGEISSLHRYIFIENAIGLITKSGLLYSNALHQDKLKQLRMPDVRLECPVGCIHRNTAISAAEKQVLDVLTRHCKEIWN